MSQQSLGFGNCGPSAGNKRVLFRMLAAGGLVAGFCSVPAWAQEPDLKNRLEALEREIGSLKAQMKDQATAAASSPAKTGPEVTFGGQYRINAYSADNDIAGVEKQTASRVRIRQNVDIQFSPQFKTHLQMELGHTTDNVDTTNNSNRGNALAVRHAVMDYTAANGVNVQAGIVPLGDYFGDTLFSSDWNYNPVALAAMFPAGSGKLRAFAGTLNETVGPGGETVSKDDTTHYQLDYVLPLTGGNQLNFGVSYLTLTPDAVPTFRSAKLVNYGVGGKFNLGGLTLNALALGSKTDRVIFDPAGTLRTGDGSGVAFKLELTGKAGSGEFGIMATRASGRRAGNGFIPIMAAVRTNGYWGYTGILTVQGPTDTGIDGDSVNVSNNGYGLSTVQAKYGLPITANLSGYVGAGWFGDTDTPIGRSGDVGTDFVLMGTYRFTKELALNFGAGRANLKDGVSGYSNGIIGTAPFNQAAGVSRNKSALFARLQAEF